MARDAFRRSRRSKTQLAAAARLRQVLRHHQGWRFLLRPHVAVPQQHVHHARQRPGIPAAEVLLHRRHLGQRGEVPPATRAGQCRPAVLLVRCVYRRALADARLAGRHRQVPRQVRPRLRTDPRGPFPAAEAVGPDRPELAAFAASWRLGGRGQQGLGIALHGGLRGHGGPDGSGDRPHHRRTDTIGPIRQHAGPLSARQRRLRRGDGPPVERHEDPRRDLQAVRS